MDGMMDSVENKGAAGSCNSTGILSSTLCAALERHHAVAPPAPGAPAHCACLT